jgi:hypothetical protein
MSNLGTILNIVPINYHLLKIEVARKNELEKVNILHQNFSLFLSENRGATPPAK